MEVDVIQLIDNYLNRLTGSTIEQTIMQKAKVEIVELRKERDHLTTQLINMGEKK